MEIGVFFKQLWQDYIRMAPQAARIHALFAQDNPQVLNDHVAFRTFNSGSIRLEALEAHLVALGYRRLEPYLFEQKKLSAWGYVHENPAEPRIFLSELLTEQLSPAAQGILKKLVLQVDPARAAAPDVFWAGRLWSAPSFEDYETLLAESEYAAWVAAIGLRVNHFTVSVNALSAPDTLAGVVERVERAGFAINASGGKFKGTPEELLEQASTLADRMPVAFADGRVETIPTCYYEFARRYPDARGRLYQGFVAASADKIFESTDVRVRTR